MLEGMVHAETQVRPEGVDLTVAQVHAVRSPGALDFGGSELEAAGTHALSTKQRDPDDEHGWWELGKGHHLIEYNETLSVEHRGLRLEPREALLEAGVSHPTVTVTEGLPLVPLIVPGPGLRIKENARVSVLRAPEPR